MEQDSTHAGNDDTSRGAGDQQAPTTSNKKSRTSAGKRPSQEACLAHLSLHQVTKKKLAEHFKVSETTMSRVIDELNEDFIQAGPSERIVCSKKGRRTVWWHTTDPDEITTYVEEHGRIGRDLDVYVHEVHSGGDPIILGTETIRRDLPLPDSVSHMKKVEPSRIRGERGG